MSIVSASPADGTARLRPEVRWRRGVTAELERDLVIFFVVARRAGEAVHAHLLSLSASVYDAGGRTVLV
jgi:hypothetical protein